MKRKLNVQPKRKAAKNLPPVSDAKTWEEIHETDLETDASETTDPGDDEDLLEPSPEELVPEGNQLPATIETSAPDPERQLSAISPTDPVRRYFEEVSRIPLLEPAQEMELALKLRDTGDLKAAKALVSANLRLVVKIALEYRNIYANLLDLIQEGNIGLMKAVSKFDPTKGARLGYYASWWIRSYILKYLLDNFRLVKIGTTQAQKKLFYHLLREKDRIEAQGLLAGPKLLAERLEVREKDVVEMQKRLSSQGTEVALDAPLDPYSDSKRGTHMDQLVQDEEGADERMARNQLLDILAERLPDFKKTLGEKELRVLEERILNDEPKTLQEIADRYGLTRERARQIEAKVIQKLREFLDL